jgi:hypothetical protein
MRDERKALKEGKDEESRALNEVVSKGLLLECYQTTTLALA